MTLKRGWPDGPDHVSEELRRALDEAAHRLPDDMSLRRVWATVATPPEPPRARRRLWFAGAVASATAAVVLAGVWVWPRATELVQTVRAHTFGHADVAGERRLTLEGGVEAVIGRSGVMRIDDGAPRVEAGEVRFSVPHRRPGHPFVVRVQEYHVVVVGTRFGIAVQDGATLVDVDEGVVEVWDAQHRLARLTPGESWRSPQREAAAETPPPAPLAAPAPAPVAAAPEPSFVVPSAIAHAHRFTKRTGRSVALASPGAPAEASERTAPSSDGIARDPAVAARAALASGDAPRALQLYRTLAQGTGPEAENAAYEVGKVLNERMGQPAGAVNAWRRYRAAYPDGILRVEADVSIIETLAKSGDSDGALAEASDFLHRRPDSERRAEIARLAGDLYRARGDCRHAVGMYQIAASASRPRDAVEAAAAHRAECQARLSGEDAR
jgi:transmembrane sensor